MKFDATRTSSQPGTRDTDWLAAWQPACPLHQHWYGRHIDAAQSPATPWSGRRSGSVDSISLTACQLLVTEDTENLNEPATVRTNLMRSDMTSWQEGGSPYRSAHFTPLRRSLVLGTWDLVLEGWLQRYEKDWLETWIIFCYLQGIWAFSLQRSVITLFYIHLESSIAYNFIFICSHFCTTNECNVWHQHNL